MNAIASIALATTLIFGGAGATALAAQSSRPDQPLYGVKLVTEDLRLSLAATPEERVSLALDLVHLRVQEARDLVDDRRAVPEYIEERLQRHTQAALEAAAEVDDTRIELILKRIAVRSAAEVRALRVLRTHAPEDRGLILAEQVITDLHTEAEQAKEDPEQFRLNQHSGDPDPRPEATLTPAWWPTAWATAAAPIEATEGSRPGPCPDDAPCAPWHDDAAPTAETDAPVAPTHQPIVPAPATAVPTVVDPNPWPVPAIPTAVAPIPTVVVPIPTVVVPIPTVVVPIPTVVVPIPVPGHDSDNSGPSLPGPWRP